MSGDQTKWREAILAFLRYGGVGLAQNAISYVAILGLLTLGVAPWKSMIVLYPAAIALTFLVNRAWTFGARPRVRGQSARYVAVYALTYPLAVIMLWLLERAGMPGWLATGLVIGAAAVWTFALLNLWVFRRSA